MVIGKGGKAFAIASTAAKRADAISAGATAACGYEDDWNAMLGGSGRAFDVVYDSTGSQLTKSLAAVRPGGSVVLFGMAGGDPPRIDPRSLMPESKALIGADLWTHLGTPAERRRRSRGLFSALRSGAITPPHTFVIPMSEGAEAHRLLEDRTFAGKVVLDPRR